MNAIITDMCARVFPVTVAATDSDAAIREIAYQHRDILGHCGMPSSCTSEHFLDDLRGMEPQWQENIRIQTWWATLGPWESDDRMARALIADPSRATAPFTGVFLNVCAEQLAFPCRSLESEQLAEDVYGRIRDGLTDFTQETTERFSRDWVDGQRMRMPPLSDVIPGLKYCEWAASEDDDFGQLRLYLFDNA